MKTLHLFAGCGGGLLCDLILGHEPVAAVEWDPYCCQVLRERAAEGWFPGLQVYEGDVRLFDPSEYEGRVDCIHAGFPCPPFSVAGKRRGAMDDRNMWPATARVIGEVRPRWVFLENVGGFVSSGYGWTVLSDLSRLGYDARWTLLGADQAGAPHRRERWWCLAHATGREIYERKRGNMEEAEGRRESFDAAPGAGSADVADAADFGRGQRDTAPGGTREGETAEREWCGSSNCGCVPNSICEGLEERDGSGSRQAQSPAVLRNWWSVEPDLGRMVNGVASRVDRLKALGNGQVPIQSALAFLILRGNYGIV